MMNPQSQLAGRDRANNNNSTLLDSGCNVVSNSASTGASAALNQQQSAVAAAASGSGVGVQQQQPQGAAAAAAAAVGGGGQAATAIAPIASPSSSFQHVIKMGHVKFQKLGDDAVDLSRTKAYFWVVDSQRRLIAYYKHDQALKPRKTIDPTEIVSVRPSQSGQARKHFLLIERRSDKTIQMRFKARLDRDEWLLALRTVLQAAASDNRVHNVVSSLRKQLNRVSNELGFQITCDLDELAHQDGLFPFFIDAIDAGTLLLREMVTTLNSRGMSLQNLISRAILHVNFVLDDQQTNHRGGDANAGGAGAGGGGAGGELSPLNRQQFAGTCYDPSAKQLEIGVDVTFGNGDQQHDGDDESKSKGGAGGGGGVNKHDADKTKKKDESDVEGKMYSARTVEVSQAISMLSSTLWRNPQFEQWQFLDGESAQAAAEMTRLLRAAVYGGGGSASSSGTFNPNIPNNNSSSNSNATNFTVSSVPDFRFSLQWSHTLHQSSKSAVVEKYVKEFVNASLLRSICDMIRRLLDEDEQERKKRQRRAAAANINDARSKNEPAAPTDEPSSSSSSSSAYDEQHYLPAAVCLARYVRGVGIQIDGVSVEQQTPPQLSLVLCNWEDPFITAAVAMSSRLRRLAKVRMITSAHGPSSISNSGSNSSAWMSGVWDRAASTQISAVLLLQDRIADIIAMARLAHACREAEALLSSKLQLHDPVSVAWESLADALMVPVSQLGTGNNNNVAIGGGGGCGGASFGNAGFPTSSSSSTDFAPAAAAAAAAAAVATATSFTGRAGSPPHDLASTMQHLSGAATSGALLRPDSSSDNLRHLFNAAAGGGGGGGGGGGSATMDLSSSTVAGSNSNSAAALLLRKGSPAAPAGARANSLGGISSNGTQGGQNINNNTNTNMNQQHQHLHHPSTPADAFATPIDENELVSVVRQLSRILAQRYATFIQHASAVSTAGDNLSLLRRIVRKVRVRFQNCSRGDVALLGTAVDRGVITDTMAIVIAPPTVSPTSAAVSNAAARSSYRRHYSNISGNSSPVVAPAQDVEAPKCLEEPMWPLLEEQSVYAGFQVNHLVTWFRGFVMNRANLVPFPDSDPALAATRGSGAGGGGAGAGKNDFDADSEDSEEEEEQQRMLGDLVGLGRTAETRILTLDVAVSSVYDNQGSNPMLKVSGDAILRSSCSLNAAFPGKRVSMHDTARILSLTLKKARVLFESRSKMTAITTSNNGDSDRDVALLESFCEFQESRRDVAELVRLARQGRYEAEQAARIEKSGSLSVERLKQMDQAGLTQAAAIAAIPSCDYPAVLGVTANRGNGSDDFTDLHQLIVVGDDSDEEEEEDSILVSSGLSSTALAHDSGSSPSSQPRRHADTSVFSGISASSPQIRQQTASPIVPKQQQQQQQQNRTTSAAAGLITKSDLTFQEFASIILHYLVPLEARLSMRVRRNVLFVGLHDTGKSLLVQSMRDEFAGSVPLAPTEPTIGITTTLVPFADWVIGCRELGGRKQQRSYVTEFEPLLGDSGELHGIVCVVDAKRGDKELALHDKEYLHTVLGMKKLKGLPCLLLINNMLASRAKSTHAVVDLIQWAAACNAGAHVQHAEFRCSVVGSGPASLCLNVKAGASPSASSSTAAAAAAAAMSGSGHYQHRYYYANRRTNTFAGEGARDGFMWLCKVMQVTAAAQEEAMMTGKK